MWKPEIKGRERIKAFFLYTPVYFFSVLPKEAWQQIKTLFLSARSKKESFDHIDFGYKLRRPKGMLILWLMTLILKTGFFSSGLNRVEWWFFLLAFIYIQVWFLWERGDYVPWYRKLKGWE